MSEWTSATIGDVADVNSETTPKDWSAHRQIKYVDISSVSQTHGVDPGAVRTVAFGEAPGRARRRVRANDVLVSTVRPNLRASAVVPESLDGEVASTGFAVVRARTKHAVPGFMWCLVSSDRFVDEMVARCTGSNYPAIRGDDVATFKFLLPPLDEQRRIVGVMASIDGLIEAVEREVEVSALLMERVLADAMQNISSSVAYGSLATTRSGPSWSADNETKTPVDGSTQVVKITNTKSDGSLDLSDKTYVLDLPDSTATLNAGSLIIIRTNGNRSRIGQVYRPTPAVYGCAVSAFQFISQANDPGDRDFLYWALREPAMQQRMSEAASGSTGLGNLAVKWLNAVAVPWSENLAERDAVVERLDATQATVERLSAELAALRIVRADLLNALLSQEMTVDAAVDKFVKAA